MEEIYSRYSNRFWKRLDGKTILVSGASGMLASYFVCFLVYLNEVQGFKINIITLTRNENTLRERFGVYTDREYFKNFTDDICKPLSCIKDDVHFIVHAASIAEPKLFTVMPVDVAAPNMVGTFNLLELAREKQCESFLFFSTSAVYDGNVNDDSLLCESCYGCHDPSNIRFSYALSKAAGELLLKSYNVQWNVPCKTVRIEFAFSPMIIPKHGEQAVSDFLRCALDGDSIKLRSVGQNLRSYVFGVDSVCAFAKILLDGESGETYNLSNTDEQLKLTDVARIIANISNVELIIPNSTAPQTVTHNMLDNSKLRSLGWTCNYTAKNGFSRIFASHKERQH